MKVNISALGHARKLKFTSYIYLLSLNQIFQYRQVGVILCNVGEVLHVLFEHGLYISVLKHVRC